MPQTNVEIFAAKGMIADRERLPKEGRDLINRMTATEVQQLVDMWERLGRPELPEGYHAMIF